MLKNWPDCSEITSVNVTVVTAPDFLCRQYREAAKRRKNTAHGASRGYSTKKWRSPNGAKDSASYIRQYFAAYDFQHPRPASDDKGGVPQRSVRLPRRYYPRNAGNRTHHQRHRGPRSCPYTYPAGPFCRGSRSCDQGELLGLGSDEMVPKLCLANRIRSFQRQRIQRRSSDQIYCESGRTSQKPFVSGRVFGIPQEEQCGLRCETSLGLVSVAPSGLGRLLPTTPRLTPWAALWRRFAAVFTDLVAS